MINVVKSIDAVGSSICQNLRFASSFEDKTNGSSVSVEGHSRWPEVFRSAMLPTNLAYRLKKS